MKIENIEFARVHVDELNIFDGNPRRGDVAAISQSLRVHGQYRPIVVNRGSLTGRPNEVLAGNHTLLAARSIGWEHIDVGFVDVDLATAKSIVAADNRLADLGEYDEKLLADLLSDLDSLVGTGYSDKDLEELLDSQAVPESLTDKDDAPTLPDNTVTVTGDVWELGPHRLLCGDCTDTSTVVEKLMSDGLAQCVWTDPPYGVDYTGSRGYARAKIAGDTGEGLEELLSGAFATVLCASLPDVTVYVAYNDGRAATFEKCFVESGLVFRQRLVWVKEQLIPGNMDYQGRHETFMLGHTPPGDGSDGIDDFVIEHPYYTQHGYVGYGVAKGGGLRRRRSRGAYGWYGGNNQTSVFQFPKPQKSKLHPTMKPVDLITSMLKNSAQKDDIVLDLFGGSGSTLIACHLLGLKARLVELEPAYCDVICKRYQEHTGIIPVRVGSDGERVEVSFLE